MAVLIDHLISVRHRVQIFRSLRHRDFRWFWLSTTAQAAARGMQFLILGWLVLVLTDSSSQLGLVVFLYGVPNLAFVLFGGIIADRIDRRKMLIGTQTAVSAIIFILATLMVTDSIVIWHLYAATLLLGTLQAINMPARMAIVSDLVERDDLMNAVVLNSAVMNSGRILGPALAGGLIELYGIGAALYVNAFLYLISVVSLVVVRHVSAIRPGRKTSILGDLFEGLRFYWKTPAVFTMITIGFAMGFFGMPYVQILPAFAKDVLGAGAGEAGLLITGAGVGSLVGTVILASLGDSPHKNRVLLISIFGFGVSLLVFAWTQWFWATWLTLLFVGMGTSMIPMITTILQLTVPTEFQGRVLSLWYLSAGLMFVGALPMAMVADAVNWPIAITGGAVLYLLIAFWLGLWRPTLRRLKV